MIEDQKNLIKNQEPKLTLLGFLAYLYLAVIIVAIMLYGPSPIFYALFVVIAGLLILPGNHFLGLILAIGLTMIFERYFTLTGLVWEEEVYKLYLLDLVLIFSFLSWLISYFKKRTKLLFGWPEILLLFFLSLVAIYFIRSLLDINADPAVAFSSFKNYSFYPLIYFLVIYTLDNQEKFKKILHLFLLVAVGLIAFIAIGFLNGSGLWTEFTPLSTAGVRYLAGTHALYMLLAWLLAAAMLFYNRIRSPFLALLILAAWTLGIGVSLMRHLWLALLVGSATLFIFMERSGKKNLGDYAVKVGLAIGSVVVLVMLIFNLTYFNFHNQSLNQNFSGFGDRLISLTNLSADTSASWRSDLWRDAKQLWQQDPLFGVGFGKSLLIDWGDYKNFEEVRNIHNSPLAILVQMGLMGFGALAIFIIAVLIAAVPKIFANHDLKPYYLGILAGIIAFLFASLFQPYLETNLLGIWFWLFLGLLRTATNLCRD